MFSVVIIILLLFFISIFCFCIIQKNPETFIIGSALNFAAASRAKTRQSNHILFGHDEPAMFGSSPIYNRGLYDFTNRFQGSYDVLTGQRIF